jgi:MoxR-like ATPase
MAATGTGTFNNFIGGESVAAAGGGTTDVINPADGEVMAQAPDSGAEDVERAVAAARAAFDGWSNTTPGERSLALLKLSRCRAALDGRDFVTPDDVKSVAVPALTHRLMLRPELWVQRVSSDDVVVQALETVPTPPAEDVRR